MTMWNWFANNRDGCLAATHHLLSDWIYALLGIQLSLARLVHFVWVPLVDKFIYFDHSPHLSSQMCVLYTTCHFVKMPSQNGYVLLCARAHALQLVAHAFLFFIAAVVVVVIIAERECDEWNKRHHFQPKMTIIRCSRAELKQQQQPTLYHVMLHTWQWQRQQTHRAIPINILFRFVCVHTFHFG